MRTVYDPSKVIVSLNPLDDGDAYTLKDFQEGEYITWEELFGVKYQIVQSLRGRVSFKKNNKDARRCTILLKTESEDVKVMQDWFNAERQFKMTITGSYGVNTGETDSLDVCIIETALSPPHTDAASDRVANLLIVGGGYQSTFTHGEAE